MLTRIDLDGREETVLADGNLDPGCATCESLSPGRYRLEVEIPANNHNAPHTTASFEIVPPQ